MEQETMFKEIMNAFKLHSEHIDKRFVELEQKFDKRFDEIDKRFEEVDKRFDEIDKRFDRVETKVDGVRMDLTDTQKTMNFLLRKVTDYDEKLLELSQQQK